MLYTYEYIQSKQSTVHFYNSTECIFLKCYIISRRDHTQKKTTNFICTLCTVLQIHVHGTYCLIHNVCEKEKEKKCTLVISTVITSIIHRCPCKTSYFTSWVGSLGYMYLTNTLKGGLARCIKQSTWIV